MKTKRRAKKNFFIIVLKMGDSIMDMEVIAFRENTKAWAELGLQHLQYSLGKTEISVTDAVNAFMAAKDKKSSTHIYVFTIMLMKTRADEFNNVTAPGVMEAWIKQLAERYEGLPESLDDDDK